MKMQMESKIGTKELEKRVEAIMKADGMSKSARMKELFKLGLEVKDIASMLNVRYNFVYNVVSNMVIVDGIKVEESHKESKKDKAWELFDAGKTVKEVAVEMKTSYNYIHKLHTEWKAAAVAEVEKMEEAK